MATVSREAKTALLIQRLWYACQRLPDYGGDMFSRGKEIIERKYGVVCYLNSFKPVGAHDGEMASTEVEITMLPMVDTPEQQERQG